MNELILHITRIKASLKKDNNFIKTPAFEKIERNLYL
jgi:hypothetical protein